jgi:hypothetical protein|tara:strand:+ start:256 stop:645 length:390 start_codon:yes stop_codon:yes gene_type:complete
MIQIAGLIRVYGSGIADNPKFTYKVGAPKSKGEYFMKAKKYNMGGMMGAPAAPAGPAAPAMVDPARAEAERKKKLALMRMMQAKGGGAPAPGQGSGGGMPAMKKGGKVRGCGMAKQGVRKAKMVVMKGA